MRLKCHFTAFTTMFTIIVINIVTLSYLLITDTQPICYT
jgi:hypothetical protein